MQLISHTTSDSRTISFHFHTSIYLIRFITMAVNSNTTKGIEYKIIARLINRKSGPYSRSLSCDRKLISRSLKMANLVSRSFLARLVFISCRTSKIIRCAVDPRISCSFFFVRYPYPKIILLSFHPVSVLST